MPPDDRPRLARGTLSRAVILDAAARTLARPGAPRVTMRALAQELGADPTAVYRHFRGKDDLLGALTDRLLAPLADPPPAPTWRAQLEALAVGLDTILTRSPGAVAVLADSPFTPASRRALDATVAALLAHGLPPALAVRACQAVVALVIGHAAAAAGDPAGFWGELLPPGLPDDELPALRATAGHWAAPPRQVLHAALALVLEGVGASHRAA